MAATINVPVYSDALVVLGTAGIIVPLVKRWGLSPVLGYLGAGAALGPIGLGSFVGQVPLLTWITVGDARNVAGIADLGVVFLLFLIGLELSYERLKAMRRLVFGLGGVQFVAATLAIAAVALKAGERAEIALILGASLALSSTAIVLEVLSNEGRLKTTTGRTSFAVLLAQDLAVIPILVFISILGSDTGASVGASAARALAEAVLAVGLITIIGRRLLKPLFRLVAQAKSSELFIAAVLFVVVGTGVVAALANLSMALGAFIAGLLLAETEYRKAIEATVEPFKGLLLGIFFFTVGMNIDARELLRYPLALGGGVIGLVTVKAAIMYAAARLFRQSRKTSLETALLLAPGGEFAFVAIGLALSLGLVSQGKASFVLALTSVTMAMIPAMNAIAKRLKPLVTPPSSVAPELMLQPVAATKHAIVVGYGRVGKVVCGLMKEHGLAYTATDSSTTVVTTERRAGAEVYYGDASKPDFLKACGLMDAAGVVITAGARAHTDEVVAQIRQLRPDILVIARARDADHARHLYALGVSDAVPDTIEASLQLSEAALVGLGRPTGLVIASIHEARDVIRRDLQTAARDAGRDDTRGVRARSRPNG